MTATVKGLSVTAGGGTHETPPIQTVWPNSGSLTVPLPAGGGAPASGDAMLLPIFVRVGGATIDLTSGWTLKSTDNQTGTNTTGEVQAKIAGGSEANPTVTDGELSQGTGAVVITIDGWSGDLADIIATGSTGASVNNQAPAETAPVDDCLVLRVFMAADDNAITTPPSGHTQLFYEVTGTGSDAFYAVYSQDAVANAGAVAAATLVMNASDGWLAFTIIVPPAAVATNVVPGDATHAQTADQPALTQVHEIAVDSATHAQTADAPGVVSVHVLAPSDAVHAQAAEEPTLTQVHVVGPEDATHAQTADQPDVTQAHALAVSDALHTQTADEPVLTQAHAVSANDAAHSQSAESPALTQVHDIGSEDATHAQTAERPNLSLDGAIVVHSAAHAQTADQPSLVQVQSIAVNDAAHAQTAEQSTLAQLHLILVNSALHSQTADSPILNVPSVAAYVVSAILESFNGGPVSAALPNDGPASATLPYSA
jgi:hypothetical protein